VTRQPSGYPVPPLPPGSFGRPVVGESIAFAKDPVAFVNERRERYGPVFKTHLIGSKTVFLTDAGANRWIFAGEGDYLENKWNKSTRRLLGDQCTAMLTGPEHTERRRLLMPHFRHSAMRSFGPTMQSIATRHFDDWASHDREVVLIPDMQRLVFELIVTLLLGDDPNVDIHHLSRLFRRWTAGISAVPLNWPFTTYHRALAANVQLQKEIDRIVSARQRLPEQPADLLGSLLSVRDDQGRPLSQEAVVHEIHNQLFAGHDTTVTVMANLMMQLAQTPEQLVAVQRELRTADLADPLDLDRLQELPRLNAALDESMRSVTPVQVTFRTMLRDMDYAGFRIPKGWTLCLAIAGTHHKPEVWTAPDRFDPERWCPARAEQNREGHSYIPFGGGPRMCLGANFAYAEMRVMLALLARDYRWVLVEGQDLSYRRLPFPRPRSGIRVRFSRLG
jgi:cytochrome P450